MIDNIHVLGNVYASSQTHTNNVNFVVKNIREDLVEFQRAYSMLVKDTRMQGVFSDWHCFLAYGAIRAFGVCIYDPYSPNKTIYHEISYKVLTAEEAHKRNPYGIEHGHSTPLPIAPLLLPLTVKISSVQFAEWIVWSSHMVNLSEEQQRNIVWGTQWEIPSRCPKFEGRKPEGIKECDRDWYGCGNLATLNREFRYETENRSSQPLTPIPPISSPRYN